LLPKWYDFMAHVDLESNEVLGLQSCG
jgi:hypothetical protein